ncbi:hypothetical protein IR215_17960 [Simulacricoccus sp. 17bor-14]|nr:hypothetical protein [Simulacricoccus sp. 17bor-14]
MDAALAHARRARAAFALERPSRRGEAEREAWELELAAQWARGEEDEALREAQRLLAVYPSASFSQNHFPPEALAALERVRGRAQEEGAPELVRAPPVRRVWISSLQLAPEEAADAPWAPAPRSTPAPGTEARGIGLRRGVGFALVATGALLLTGGVLFAHEASSREAAGRVLPPDSALAGELRAGSRRFTVMADVGVLVGLACAGTGGYLALSSPHPRSGKRDEPPRERPWPADPPGGADVTAGREERTGAGEESSAARADAVAVRVAYPARATGPSTREDVPAARTAEPALRPPERASRAIAPAAASVRTPAPPPEPPAAVEAPAPQRRPLDEDDLRDD